MDTAEARRKTGLPGEGLVLLFFGFVRDYKGLNVLLEAFPAMRKNTGCRLMVVGEFAPGEREDYGRRIREADGGEGGITVVDRYVPDSEVEQYFAACDIVVLPYLSATQSGVATIAYGFGKPVVVTDVGGLPEVVVDGETGYVVPAGSADALAEAVGRFAGEEDRAHFSEAIRRESYRFSWDRLADVIEEIAEE